MEDFQIEDLKEGDVKLFPSVNGYEIRFIEGEPIFDPGLENAIFLSWSCPNWWGNAISTDREKLDSTVFDTIFENGIVTDESILDLKTAFESSVSWLVNENIADNIEVEITIISLREIEVKMSVQRPNFTEENLKYSIAWDLQKEVLIQRKA